MAALSSLKAIVDGRLDSTTFLMKSVRFLWRLRWKLFGIGLFVILLLLATVFVTSSPYRWLLLGLSTLLTLLLCVGLTSAQAMRYHFLTKDWEERLRGLIDEQTARERRLKDLIKRGKGREAQLGSLITEGKAREAQLKNLVTEGKAREAQLKRLVEGKAREVQLESLAEKVKARQERLEGKLAVLTERLAHTRRRIDDLSIS